MNELIPSWLQWDENSIRKEDKKSSYFSYTSGIKDIQIRQKEFENKSCIVTKPMTIDGNILSVSLSTEESLPSDSSIEYYVSFMENPLIDDWIPISSSSLNTVTNEKLFINNQSGKSLPLRFIPEEGSVVMKENGEIINRNLWSYSAGEKTITKNNINPLSTYTVSYTIKSGVSSNKIIVDEKYKNIKDYSENGIDGEWYNNGTDIQGSIFLSKTPYIDRSLLSGNYTPVVVNLYGKMLYSNGSPTFASTNPLIPILDFSQSNTGVPIMRNKTDYINNENISLISYNPKWDTSLNSGSGAMVYPVFEYLHSGRQLIFTEPFNNFGIYANNSSLHGNGKLVVYYKYINLTFRMKIIMRNLSSQYNSLTPIIKSYTLTFEVET